MTSTRALLTEQTTTTRRQTHSRQQINLPLCRCDVVTPNRQRQQQGNTARNRTTKTHTTFVDVRESRNCRHATQSAHDDRTDDDSERDKSLKNERKRA
jgi:hypothetical protein